MGDPAGTPPYVAAPGTYILRLKANFEGACDGQRGLSLSELSYLLVGDGD